MLLDALSIGDWEMLGSLHRFPAAIDPIVYHITPLKIYSEEAGEAFLIRAVRD